jgi:hypothetical protein
VRNSCERFDVRDFEISEDAISESVEISPRAHSISTTAIFDALSLRSVSGSRSRCYESHGLQDLVFFAQHWRRALLIVWFCGASRDGDGERLNFLSV